MQLYSYLSKDRIWTRDVQIPMFLLDSLKAEEGGIVFFVTLCPPLFAAETSYFQNRKQNKYNKQKTIKVSITSERTPNDMKTLLSLKTSFFFFLCPDCAAKLC